MIHNPCQTKKKTEKRKFSLSLSHPRLLPPSLIFAPGRWKFSSPFLWIWSSITESLSSSSISSRMFFVIVAFRSLSVTVLNSISPFHLNLCCFTIEGVSFFFVFASSISGFNCLHLGLFEFYMVFVKRLG